MIYTEQLPWEEIDIPMDDVFQILGYRKSCTDTQILDYISDVLTDLQHVTIPSYSYQILDAEKLSASHVRIGTEIFHVGGIIGSYLDGMTSACLFIATAGREYDSFVKERYKRDILFQFIADAIGSVVADSCANRIGDRLDSQCRQSRTLPYSPGYCGWNICEQRKLFSFFPPFPSGVSLSDSCLMTPIKSVSGFYGLGTDIVSQPYRCGICTNKKCYKRMKSE